MAGNDQYDNSPGDGWEIEDDLDKVQTRKEVPPGRWLCRVASMEMKKTKDKSKDYFNISFEVIDVDKAELEDVIGSRVWDIFNVNQQALWKLKALISACGFDSTRNRVPNLTDCEVVLDTFEDEYEGNRSIKTKRYKNPFKETWTGLHEQRDAGGATGAKAEADAAKEAAKAGSKLGTGQGSLSGKKIGSGPKPQTSTGGSKAKGGSDDEVEV
jgi:hypothetical protein